MAWPACLLQEPVSRKDAAGHPVCAQLMALIMPQQEHHQPFHRQGAACLM